MQGAWAVEWIESERGWGQRPDGCWLYPSKGEAETKTSELVKSMRDSEKKIYKGAIPDEYSYPETPQFIPIGPLTAERVSRGPVYLHRVKEAEE